MGDTPIDWTATQNTQPWISFTASSGTLAGSESIGIAVLINSDANSLAPGSHSDSVVFNNTTNGNGTTFRPVSLTVNSSPGHLSIIQPDGFTSSGNQGGPFSPPYKSYTLVNTGGTPISWTATKTQPWVSLSQTNGTLAVNGENIVVAVQINTSANNLAPGIYGDTVSFTNTTNGNGNVTRAVALTVNCVSIGQADSDCDADVDGLDLFVFSEQFGLGTNTVSIEEFANNFGW
jgi:hypothetical protein